jgi:hypothetical protein
MECERYPYCLIIGYEGSGGTRPAMGGAWLGDWIGDNRNEYLGYGTYVRHDKNTSQKRLNCPTTIFAKPTHSLTRAAINIIRSCQIDATPRSGDLHSTGAVCITYGAYGVQAERDPPTE